MLARPTAADAGTHSNRFELCSSVDARLTEEARRKSDAATAEPEVQFHRNTTLPGQEEIVRRIPMQDHSLIGT
jgi:hypothetical protein